MEGSIEGGIDGSIEGCMEGSKRIDTDRPAIRTEGRYQGIFL